MSAHRYEVGARIFLNEGPIRFASHNGPCRIVGILPASFNEPQYRVRFEGENFERCISESDIDSQNSSRAAPVAGEQDKPRSGAWVTSLATTKR